MPFSAPVAADSVRRDSRACTARRRRCLTKAIRQRSRPAVFPPCSGDAAKSLVVRPGEYDLAIISPGLDAGWPLPKKVHRRRRAAHGRDGVRIHAHRHADGRHHRHQWQEHLHGVDRSAVQWRGQTFHSLWQSRPRAFRTGRKWRSLRCARRSRSVPSSSRPSPRFRPKVSIWLNFAPDHLDRYPDVESYYKAKVRIFENQTADDWAVIRAGENVGDIKARRITFSIGDRRRLHLSRRRILPPARADRRCIARETARPAQHGEHPRRDGRRLASRAEF